MRYPFLALGGVVLLLATACGASHRGTAAGAAATTTVPARTSTPTTTGEAGGTTTIPTATTIPTSATSTSSTTSPTTVPDTAIVPKQITVAYVDAVLAKLNHVYGDAVRTSVADRKVTVPAVEDLSAIYSPKLAAEEETIFVQEISGSLANVRRVPGDPITEVQDLIYSSDSCIYARVQTNSDPLVIHPVSPLADEFMGLKRIVPGDGLGLNHTPWIFFFDLVNKTPTDVPDQCPVA
jgi:hypothetical protein